MNTSGNSSDSPTHSRADSLLGVSPGKTGHIYFETTQSKDLFNQNGFSEFDDFWNLPHEFVDDVNYRRGGWSAVSTLELADSSQGKKLFFVKRQENQPRYSLRHPFGRLTFEIEVDAIKRVKLLGLPAVDVACWGVQKADGSRRAIVVTRAIEYPTLLDLINSDPDWDAVLPLLRQCGAAIYRMHQQKIRHGALYPNHIFLDPQTAKVQLIDFEGSRKCRSIYKAIQPDMKQLLKRLGAMPIAAREALLEPYFKNHNKLLTAALKNRDTD